MKLRIPCLFSLPPLQQPRETWGEFRQSMPQAQNKSIVPVEHIASRIYLIRGEKMMLDYDLSELYGIPTKVLNQAVSRNRDRFPEDFMFRLSHEETDAN